MSPIFLSSPLASRLSAYCFVLLYFFLLLALSSDYSFLLFIVFFCSSLFLFFVIVFLGIVFFFYISFCLRFSLLCLFVPPVCCFHLFCFVFWSSLSSFWVLCSSFSVSFCASGFPSSVYSSILFVVFICFSLFLCSIVVFLGTVICVYVSFCFPFSLF